MQQIDIGSVTSNSARFWFCDTFPNRASCLGSMHVALGPERVIQALYINFSVPDALRTKYEPDVEKEEASFAKEAAKLSTDEAQVQND